MELLKLMNNENLGETKIRLFREINNVIDEISDKEYEIKCKIDDLYRLRGLLKELKNHLNDLGYEITNIKFDEDNSHEELIDKAENDLEDLKRKNNGLIID